MPYKYKYVGGDARFISTKKDDFIVATQFTRIVNGSRGAYVEFDPEYVQELNLTVKEGEWSRLSSNLYYYVWLTTPDGVKVYFQKRPVSYADYKVGYIYVSPADLKNFERDGKY